MQTLFDESIKFQTKKLIRAESREMLAFSWGWTDNNIIWLIVNFRLIKLY